MNEFNNLSLEQKRSIVYSEMLSEITKNMDEAGRTRIIAKNAISFKSPDGKATLTLLAVDKINEGEIKVQCLYENDEVEKEGFFTYKKDEFCAAGTILVNYIYDNIKEFIK